MNRRRVLLVGATGAFGRRLAELLARDPGLELVLAARTSRSLDELAACLRAGGARAAVATRPFERERPEALAAIAPWLVVDAAGPFQACGYTLVLAAVSAGAHYVDLADGRDFVAGFQAAVGPDAAAAGVSAVTGASSTPALSHAALERLTAGWSEIESVRVVISPGARAPRGLSVVRAILSYAGRPVRVFQHGGWVVRSGWSGLHRPSMPGLGRRLASLCETPDLDLVPARFAVTREVLFLAGLELPVMHLGLWALALLVRSGVARSLAPLAPTLRRGADVLAQLGTDRGGMIVEACGRDPRGQPVQAQWALWAEAGAGPFTPAAPAAALIRAMAAGEVVTCGAQVCVGLLSLDTILAELADLPIHTRIDAGSPEAERPLPPHAWTWLRSALAGRTRRARRARARRLRGTGPDARRARSWSPAHPHPDGPAPFWRLAAGGASSAGCTRRELDAAVRAEPLRLPPLRRAHPRRLQGARRAVLLRVPVGCRTRRRQVEDAGLPAAWPTHAAPPDAAFARPRLGGERRVSFLGRGGSPLGWPALRLPWAA